MSNKEAKSRIEINKLLEASGWRFFDNGDVKANILLEKHIKPTQANITDEFDKLDFKGGFADFILIDNKGFPIAIIEAKNEDINPLSAKEQARKYAINENCRFVLLSNGLTHYIWDLKRGNPTQIQTFPTPKALSSYSTFKPDKESLIRAIVKDDYIVLTQNPIYDKDPDFINLNSRNDFISKNKLCFLRGYQIQAIQSIQNAVKNGNDRFLFEMATGTGKTLVSAAVIKLFLKTSNAKRVLFLVDRIELEDQADKSFKAYLKNDYSCLIYKKNRDDWRKAEIVVSTIQTLLSNNCYKREFAPDSFDLVISDESHRSINGNSRAVFEYFIGYRLGLTATPKDYLKNINPDFMRQDDPRELERRTLLDTYITFGCQNGQPTFRYSLLDGVKDGFLINPIVADARTEITTKLLSDEGYFLKVPIEVDVKEDDAKDKCEQQQQESVYASDFEKTFFSEATNNLFCKTFMDHALKDPISGEIGKTICFCVSQNHAAKITQILNELADKMFPGRYNSDFALQVTSVVADSQQFTKNFSNNNLSGKSSFREDYKTSKTRVCVTVGMMTTGYDCPDILNLCLIRPIFSPTDFIQIKGRGTRKHDFSVDVIDERIRRQIGSNPKTAFKVLDFFANFEYFEEKYNYDEILELPKEAGERKPPPPPKAQPETQAGWDKSTTYNETQTDEHGWKIDRMYFNKFEEKVKGISDIRSKLEQGKWDEVIDYIENNLLDKPQEYFTLEKLRKSIRTDRRVTMREIIEKILGFIPEIKTKQELLESEFDKFDSRYLPDESYYQYVKDVFFAYITDAATRQIIDSGKFADLNVTPCAYAFQNLPVKFVKLIPEYIKDHIELSKFESAS